MPPRAPRQAGGRRTLEQKLAALRTLDLGAADAVDELRAGLRSDTGILVAAAAKLVAEHRLEPLIDALADAFERLLDDAVKRDPGCRGKVAIVHALHALDRWDDRVFVAGLRHTQPEGWGGDDTAAALRGMCGIAHAQHGRDDALDVLAALLADPERVTRAAAARGIGDAGRPDGTALLRFKLLIDDPDPEVLAACVESLLALDQARSGDLLIGLLASHDERAEVAALALGGARLGRAFAPLVAWCTGCAVEQRHRVGYLAIALLRSDPATAYLLEAIRDHGQRDALAAARALATFREDAGLRDRIRAAVRERADAAVEREVDELLVR